MSTKVSEFHNDCFTRMITGSGFRSISVFNRFHVVSRQYVPMRLIWDIHFSEVIDISVLYLEFCWGRRRNWFGQEIGLGKIGRRWKIMMMVMASVTDHLNSV